MTRGAVDLARFAKNAAAALLVAATAVLPAGCAALRNAAPPGGQDTAPAPPSRTSPGAAEMPQRPDSAVGGEGRPPAAPTQPPPPAPAPPAAKPPAPAEPHESEAQLAKAQALFEEKKFEDAGNAAERLTGNTAVGTRARELAGNAWFAAGDAALKEDRFADAVAAYRKAEPWRKDAAAALAATERRKREKAEELYNAGVRYFVDQRLDEAIISWEQTLALNPDHPNASKDIAKARGLQQKLKELR